MDVTEERGPLNRLVSIADDYKERLGVGEGIDGIAARTIEVAGAAEAAELQRPEKSILIVDEKYLTETLRIIFQMAGYHVETASSGAQALKKALDKPYDLVIMEANLPDSMGGDMAQVIRNMHTGTKVILMTGDEYWEETMKAAPAEVDDVLLKPFAPEELVSATRRILEPKTERKGTLRFKLPLA